MMIELPYYAVVLCGGKGTRLVERLSPGVPKCMADVGTTVAGVTFIEFLMTELVRLGVRSFILCIGHGQEAIRRHVFESPGHSFNPKRQVLRISFSEDPEPLGTAPALLRALPLVRSNPFLLVNGDTYCPGVDLEMAFEHHREARLSSRESLVVTLLTDNQDRHCGLAVCQLSLGAYLHNHINVEEAFSVLWRKRGMLVTFPACERFYDIGSPKGLEEFKRLCLSY